MTALLCFLSLRVIQLLSYFLCFITASLVGLGGRRHLGESDTSGSRNSIQQPHVLLRARDLLVLCTAPPDWTRLAGRRRGTLWLTPTSSSLRRGTRRDGRNRDDGRGRYQLHVGDSDEADMVFELDRAQMYPLFMFPTHSIVSRTDLALMSYVAPSLPGEPTVIAFACELDHVGADNDSHLLGNCDVSNSRASFLG